MALRLPLKKGQSIMVGVDVNIIVTEHRMDEETGDMVTVLSIDAPNHVSVDRKSIREKRIQNIDKVIEDATTRQP